MSSYHKQSNYQFPIVFFRICVHQKHICDGHNECPAGEDEADCPKERKCSEPSPCEQLCIETTAGSNECACRLGYVMDKNKVK